MRAAARLAIVMGALSCSPSNGTTSPVASPVQARVHAIVEAAAAELQIPGVTLLVEHRGRRLVARGYGFADVENRVPAELDTVYQIASLTKQFTAAAILKLVEQGKLRLEDDVTKLLPELRLDGGTVTVHHLLSHTHGIVEYNRDETIPAWGAPIEPRRVLELIGDRKLEFAPGERFQYRNSGYYLLGRIVESAAGVPYGDYLRASMFEPLGMRDTSQCAHHDIIPRRAHGYTVDDQGELRNPRFLDMSWTFAVGSLCSTAPDLLIWSRSLRGGRVISLESYRKMITPVRLADGTVTDYGYGLGVSVHDGHPLLRHGGNTVGFASYLTYYPDDDLTIVLLTNNDTVETWKLDDDISRAILGLPPRSE